MYQKKMTSVMDVEISSSPLDENTFQEPIAAEFDPIPLTGYIQKKLIDIGKRYQVNLLDLVDEFDAYGAFLDKVINIFEPLLTDFDKQEVLPSTCAMGFTKPHHTDLEFLGDLGKPETSSVTYRDDIIKAVENFYLSYAKDIDPDEKAGYSFPRGRNAGYPTPISGRRRGLTDVLLATHVGLVLCFKSQGRTLEDLSRFLEGFHGEPITIYGERLQHTAKVQPLFTDGIDLFSRNFEMRVRGIYMSPKYMVAWNRPLVKYSLSTLLKTPQHKQDRTYIVDKVLSRVSAGWLVIPLDISKFDQISGGARGLQILRSIYNVWGSPFASISYEDLEHEFKTTLVTFTRNEALARRDYPILMSGASFTTLVGCVHNTVMTTQAVSDAINLAPDKVLATMGSNWDYLSWGDDTVLMFSPDLVRRYDLSIDKLATIYSNYGITVTSEPCIKYLGNVIHHGEFRGSIDTGYGVGRMIQQQFFPERKKEYPFTTVGYIARLNLVGDKASAFHDIMFDVWDEKKMGPYFRFEDRSSVLLSLLPEVEKHAERLAEIDDILQLFVHGADANADEIDVPDDFIAFLGIGQVDLTDPAEFLSKEGLSQELFTLVRNLQEGQSEAYFPLLERITHDFDLTWRSGDVIY
jgi:hypothetical protein